MPPAAARRFPLDASHVVAPRDRVTRRFVLADLIGSSIVAVGPSSSAASTCEFDEPNATITVTIPGVETAVLSRSGDTILVGGVACEGGTTVLNTDLISVVDDQMRRPGSST
jgi:hypothetical protein